MAIIKPRAADTAKLAWERVDVHTAGSKYGLHTFRASTLPRSCILSLVLILSQTLKLARLALNLLSASLSLLSG